MIQAIQPYITAIATALIGLLATGLLALIATLRTKLESWIVARTSAAQRDLLHKVAAEAYAYVELQYGGGTDKLAAAADYVTARLSLSKLGLTGEDVIAAIQRAWAELDIKNKGGSSK